MKIRQGFVSNSSSSSFVLDKRYLTEEQIEAILNCEEILSDSWNITDDGDVISGHTWMDNGAMGEFLKEINVGLKALEGDVELWKWDMVSYLIRQVAVS